MKKPKHIVKVGDYTVELTPLEVQFRAVEYLYNPTEGDNRVVERRLATPTEVLQARYPDIMFQVSEEGYAVMKAKAAYFKRMGSG